MGFSPGAFDDAAHAGRMGGAMLIGAACLAWAIDNNLTRRISGGDAVAIAAIKGCVAGTINLSLADVWFAGLTVDLNALNAGLDAEESGMPALATAGEVAVEDVPASDAADVSPLRIASNATSAASMPLRIAR